MSLKLEPRMNITNMLLIIANIAHLRHLNKSYSVSEHQLLETTYQTTREYADKLSELLITYDLFNHEPSQTIITAFDKLRETNLMQDDNLAFILSFIKFIQALRYEFDISIWRSQIDDFELMINSTYYLMIIENRGKSTPTNADLSMITTSLKGTTKQKVPRTLDLGKMQDIIYKIMDNNSQYFDNYIEEGWDNETESFKVSIETISKAHFNKILKDLSVLEKYEFYLEPIFKNNNAGVYIIRK